MKILRKSEKDSQKIRKTSTSENQNFRKSELQSRSLPVAQIDEKKSRKKWATDRKTQDESQWIVSQRILSALTIPGFK